MQSYRPGDIVNGHRLNDEGTAWLPLEHTPSLPGPDASEHQKAAMSRAKKLGIGVGGTLLALTVVGVLSPDSDPAAGAPTPQVAVQAPASPESPVPADQPAPATEDVQSAPAQADEADLSTPVPDDEAAFISRVDTGRTDIAEASNGLRRAKALRDRDRALRRIIGSDLKVSGWGGTITDVGANGEGKAYVEVEIAPDVRVTTWNNAFSDFGDDTLIPESSTTYDTLLDLEEGDLVVFSGRFFAGSDTALSGQNLTDTFYGIDPKFVFRFSSINAA